MIWHVSVGSMLIRWSIWELLDGHLWLVQREKKKKISIPFFPVLVVLNWCGTSTVKMQCPPLVEEWRTSVLRGPGWKLNDWRRRRKMSETHSRKNVSPHSKLSITVYDFNNWGRDKMAAFFQTTFSNGFSLMKMYEFRKKCHWSLFLGVQLAIS